MTRRTIGLLLILCSLFLALGGIVAQIVVAQETKSVEEVSITQTTTFSWPVVAVLVALAFSAAGIAVSMQGHHARSDIHHTVEGLDARYRSRGECDVLHQAIMRELDGLGGDIGQIMGAMNLPRRKSQTRED